MSRFEELTLSQFAERLRAFTFTRGVTAVHMHHTFKPTQADWRAASRKVSIIEGMHRFHVTPKPKGAGFSDIAQHLSIAPDGKIWTGRDWNQTPASAAGHSAGAFMFETIGNFDEGHETLTPEQRRALVGVIALVQLKCKLPADALRFHREFPTPKSCPGTGIRKPDILAAVKEAREEFAGGPRGLAAGGGSRDAAAAASRAASVYEAAPMRTRAAEPERPAPFDAEFVEAFDVEAVAGWERGDDRSLRPGDARDARDLATFGADDDLAEDGEAAGAGRAAGGEGGDGGARGGPSAAVVAGLRPHLVNLRQGRFSGGGLAKTSPEDVDAIFDTHLPAALDEARRRGQPLRLLFWAHGGLVSEESGLEAAAKVVPWWTANGVYPIYFIWETGLWETITQLLVGSRDFRAAAARGLSDVTDAAIERVVHGPGEKVWGGMKHSAAAAVAPDGGARHVARRLAEFCRANPRGVELHAVGHSAGAIFHSHFVPAALAAADAAGVEAPRFETVSLLAPAIRVDEFLRRLVPHLGPGGGVERLALFAMDERTEKDDSCGAVYRKSLLYLIHNALEAERGAPILGLQASALGDRRVRQLLGVDGAGSPHEAIWSPTADAGDTGAAGGRSRSRSTTHGGFDNDAATMESVLRRVLAAGDATPVEPFPAAAQRDLTFAASTPALDELLDRPAAAKPAAKPPKKPAAKPAPPDDHRPHGDRGEGRRRALCIGIDYKNDRSARLKGCVNDARRWAEHFERLGFDQVDLLLEEQATEAGIVAALQDLVGSARAGDVLALQYAGHGTFFEDDGVDEKDRQDEALVPYDFTQGGGHLVLDDEQLRIFERLPEGATLTCFYDCCHSGTMSRAALRNVVRTKAGARSAGGDDMGVRFIDPTPEMVEEYRRRRAAPGAGGKRSFRKKSVPRAVAFSACRDDEVALEFGGQGDFTRLSTPLLLEAIASGATNAAFGARIVGTFDTEYDGAPAQHPGLDCAPAAGERPLLGGPAPRPNGGRGGNGAGAGAGARDAYAYGD